MLKLSRLKKRELIWSIFFLLSKIPFMPQMIQKAYYFFFSYPKSLLLELTSECNYNCIYCYTKRRKVSSLDLGQWKKVIDDAKDMKIRYFSFSGGEPFLYKNFYEVLKYASQKGFKISIFTNGSLLNKSAIDSLIKINPDIILEVKYDSKENYKDHTQNKIKLSQIEKNIKKAVERGLGVITFTTLTKDNIKKIKNIINKSLDLGTLPTLCRYHPTNDKKIDNKLEITNKEWAHALKLLKKTYSDFNKIIEGISILRGNLCSMFRDGLAITPNGFVLPCPHAPLGLNLGYVKKENLKTIWESSKTKRMSWLKSPEECKECEIKHSCNGGCKSHAYVHYNSFSFKDPLCTGKISPTYGYCANPIVHLSEGYIKLIKQLKRIN